MIKKKRRQIAGLVNVNMNHFCLFYSNSNDGFQSASFTYIDPLTNNPQKDAIQKWM
jgi:uncharacterized protein Veg